MCASMALFTDPNVKKETRGRKELVNPSPSRSCNHTEKATVTMTRHTRRIAGEPAIELCTCRDFQTQRSAVSFMIVSLLNLELFDYC